MSIWTRIREALAALAQGQGLSAVLEKLSTPPERSVAFTIAVIGLGAKMAKADGQVTRDEVRAFREVFRIAPEDEAQAARVFDLARTDVAGFDAYARVIARMFRDRPEVLADLIEGLFHIAAADGHYHPAEDAFLAEVAEIFGLAPRRFEAIRARSIPGGDRDPYVILGVARTDDLATIRSAWREMVREGHPDRMLARGVPEEAVALADRRLRDLNAAWDAIRAEREA